MKTIEVGIKAPEAITAIINNNPAISKILFAVYVPGRHSIPSHVTSKFLRHNPAKRLIGLERDEITQDKIASLASLYIGEPELLAFISKVRLQDRKEVFHLPLIDFRCEPSTLNLEKVIWFLREIGQQEGVILSSGNSYHYYGIEPLSKTDWIVFLGQCLISELVDHFYIGHQMIEKYSTLRISRSSYYPETPTVVTTLSKAVR